MLNALLHVRVINFRIIIIVVIIIIIIVIIFFLPRYSVPGDLEITNTE